MATAMANMMEVKILQIKAMAFGMKVRIFMFLVIMILMVVDLLSNGIMFQMVKMMKTVQIV